MSDYDEQQVSTSVISWLIIGVLLVSAASRISSANEYLNTEKIASITHHQIAISGFKFMPKELKVSSGDTVTWVNRDIVPHKIIVSANHKIVSPDLAAGEKFTFVVKDSLSYECSFHPSMKGGLIIP